MRAYKIFDVSQPTLRSYCSCVAGICTHYVEGVKTRRKPNHGPFAAWDTPQAAWDDLDSQMSGDRVNVYSVYEVEIEESNDIGLWAPDWNYGERNTDVPPGTIYADSVIPIKPIWRLVMAAGPSVMPILDPSVRVAQNGRRGWYHGG